MTVGANLQGYLDSEYKNLSVDVSSIDISSPPADDSHSTRMELEELEGIVAESKLPPKIMRVADRSPLSLFYAVARKKGLDPLEEEAKEWADDWTKLSFEFKLKFKRRRPYEVKREHDVDFVVDKSDTTESPSYPSGHAMMGYGVAEFYKDKYPLMSEEWDNVADIIAHSRLQMGVHYPSDVEASKRVVEQIVESGIKLAEREKEAALPSVNSILKATRSGLNKINLPGLAEKVDVLRARRNLGLAVKDLTKYQDLTGRLGQMPRIVIPKTHLDIPDLYRLGFKDSLIAVPELGQKTWTSYRHPLTNIHLHDHGKFLNMHVDSLPSLQMIAERNSLTAKARRKLMNTIPQGVEAWMPKKIRKSRVGQGIHDQVSGIGHAILEGVPGYVNYGVKSLNPYRVGMADEIISKLPKDYLKKRYGITKVSSEQSKLAAPKINQQLLKKVISGTNRSGFLTSGDTTPPAEADPNYTGIVPPKPKRKRQELEEIVRLVRDEIAKASPEDMEYSKLVASGLPMEEIVAQELVDPFTSRDNWTLTPEEYKQFRYSVIKDKKKLYPVARPYALAERYGIDLGLPEDVAQRNARMHPAFANFSYPSFHTARGAFLAETARDLVPEDQQQLVDDLIARIGRSRIQQGVHSHQDVEAGEAMGREAAKIYKELGIKTSAYKDYRPRGTLYLLDGKGGIMADKPTADYNSTTPYFFPGGGIFEEEKVDRLPTREEIIEGVEREALEELGTKLKNVRVLQDEPVNVDMPDWWRERQKKKRGLDYKGISEFFAAAERGDQDKSIYGADNDEFTGTFYPIEEVASALEANAKPGDAYYEDSMRQARLIRSLLEKQASLGNLARRAGQGIRNAAQGVRNAATKEVSALKDLPVREKTYTVGDKSRTLSVSLKDMEEINKFRAMRGKKPRNTNPFKEFATNRTYRENVGYHLAAKPGVQTAFNLAKPIAENPDDVFNLVSKLSSYADKVGQVEKTSSAKANLESQESIYDRLAPLLPEGVHHVSGGLPDAKGISDVDIFYPTGDHSDLLSKMPKGTYVSKSKPDKTIYTIPGYDREVNLFATLDPMKQESILHRATMMELAAKYPELERMAYKLKASGMGSEPAWTKVLGVDGDPYERMQHTQEMLEAAEKRTLKKTASDLSVLTAVPTQNLDLIMRKGLYSQKAMLDDPEVMAAFLAQRNADKAWKNDEQYDEKRFREQYDKRRKLIEDKGGSLESLEGPSVFFTEPDPDKVSDPRHFINKFNTETLRVNLAKLLKDIPDTRIHGAELAPWDDEAHAADPDNYYKQIHRDITPEEVSELIARGSKDLWKDYSEESLGRYYAKDVPHAFIRTPSGIIPPEYLERVEKTSSAKEQLKHILVTGHSGAGKTTYARQLAEELGIPLHRLDVTTGPIMESEYPEYWDNGTLGYPEDVATRVIQQALALDKPHVIEGSHILELPELTEGYKRILIDTPEDRVVEQRAQREYRNQARKNKPYRPIEKHREAAKELVNHYRSIVSDFRNQPGVESIVPEVKTAQDKLKHILITGQSGSGKTTEAKRLSAELGMPVVHLDQQKGFGPKGVDPDYIEDLTKATQDIIGNLDKPHIVEGTQLLSEQFPLELLRSNDLRILEADEDELVRRLTERGWNTESGRDLKGPESADEARHVAKHQRKSVDNLVERLKKKAALEDEFQPDLTPDDLKALGVYAQVYGDAPSEASMKEWPEHWINKQDPLGWLQWYDRYSEGRRTDDDERQMKRWKSFKARHLAQYLKKPTPRRAAALRNWGIDVEKY